MTESRKGVALFPDGSLHLLQHFWLDHVLLPYEALDHLQIDPVPVRLIARLISVRMRMELCRHAAYDCNCNICT